MHAPAESESSQRQFLLCVFLLWLAGIGLRVTILAVPPVIPPIRMDFGMSETQVGILTGLPPVLFACTAVLGSLLIARFGALATLVAGLFATAAGSALRGAAPDVMLLYGATIVTGFGVAIMHPSLPPLVRGWLPHRIGFGTAVFTNGLLVGEIIPVALTIPVVLPQVGESWRASFVVWAIPVALIALVIWLLAPRAARACAKHATALVAGLEGPADLAARYCARQRQRDVFFRQCIPARLSASHRTAGPRQRRADRAQSRTDSGLVPAARRRRTAGARDLAARRLRRRLARGDRRDRGAAGRGDRCVRGGARIFRRRDPHSHAGAAAAAAPNRTTCIAFRRRCSPSAIRVR